MVELFTALDTATASLEAQSPNAIAVSAGCNLFTKFVAQFNDHTRDFEQQKAELVRQGRKYAQGARLYRDQIAASALEFIQDDCVILTHSFSRVVMQALLLAHSHKRISVFVTEARPRGLGKQTHDALIKAGVPCTLILDSALAFVMDKVDLCLVGSEAVVESGGLVNAVGSYQMALVAKAANKPFYALAESYKFHRLFPLSQYDLPTHNLTSQPKSTCTGSEFYSPAVDYTRPDLITLVFSDVGILTPDGVSQYLVSMFSE